MVLKDPSFVWVHFSVLKSIDNAIIKLKCRVISEIITHDDACINMYYIFQATVHFLVGLDPLLVLYLAPERQVIHQYLDIFRSLTQDQ